MKSREEELWEYLDGQDDPRQKALLEERLRAEGALRRELALRRKLNERLNEMEPEQPSLRFTQNLMERLPQLYRRIQLKPLISPIWVKTYLVVFTLTVLSLFGFGLLSTTSSLIPLNLNLKADSFSLEMEASISMRLAIIVTGITAAALFLFWLDKRLSKRYEEG